ncbi:hypothetical protein RFI_19655 [Reticulomyxa filosa]|uniref:RanBD1 domain-containing protein n=1 Tax=Reticulomyxa filosa TaxID=46433 RepID=X6MX47_RETFI|nr:hypothetical protein RFI_19655 [Reticulomyxa filosa]|eukprot:ETO17665.1 hypothetical protein RFI_19655 [Reticulomyxa filosa]
MITFFKKKNFLFPLPPFFFYVNNTAFDTPLKMISHRGDLEANGEEPEDQTDHVEEKVEEVEIHTGEDSDENYFSCNVKIFVFKVGENNNKTWKEYVRGTLRVNYVPESNIGRLVSSCRKKKDPNFIISTFIIMSHCNCENKRNNVFYFYFLLFAKKKKKKNVSEFKTAQGDRITFGMPEEEEEEKKSASKTEPIKTVNANTTTPSTTTTESTSAKTENDVSAKTDHSESPKIATTASNHSNKIHLVTYCIKASEDDVNKIINAIQEIKVKIAENSSNEENTSA